MTLQSALDELADGSRPALPAHPETRGVDIAPSISARLGEAEVLHEVSAATLPLLSRIEESPSEQSIVNRAVSQIDQLRRRLIEDRDVDRTYRLASDLTQQTERDRYLADLRIGAAGLDDTQRRRRQAQRDMANVESDRRGGDGLDRTARRA